MLAHFQLLFNSRSTISGEISTPHAHQLSNSSLTSTLQRPAASIDSLPIQVPDPVVHRDLDRVRTPESARGVREGHLFPPHWARSRSTGDAASRKKRDSWSLEPAKQQQGDSTSRRESSSSRDSLPTFVMHSEQRYIPTSPLSPKLPADGRPPSPQSNKPRAAQGRTASRNMHMSLPRYHPLNYQPLSSAATPSSTVTSPAFGLSRLNQSSQGETPRSMREANREFLDDVRANSMHAASAPAMRPGSPRLDPLGSPNGAMTPLALDGADYFSAVRAGKPSPAVSPSAKNVGSDGTSSKDVSGGKKTKELDVYE